MTETTKVSEKKIGPIVATLIIVLVLIIAALYLFASKVKQSAIPTDTLDATTTVSTGHADLDDLRNELNDSTSGLEKENF
ncbi:MAG TPA: hypothetical protein VF438_00555 [Candidatus Paceibacterota bacterium]